MEYIFYIYVHFCLHKNEPKNAADHFSALGRFPALLTKIGRHRNVANAPPSRLSVLYCAARLREMAFLQLIFLRVPYCAAEHHSCCWEKTLKLSDPLQAESFLTSQLQREAQGSPKDRDSWGALFLLLLLSANETPDD